MLQGAGGHQLPHGGRALRARTGRDPDRRIAGDDMAQETRTVHRAGVADDGARFQRTSYGKGLDTAFIGKPHEFDARRVYSTTATDWQARVEFDRLRRDRLARARMMMDKHDLGALVCFVGENVRYITGVFQGNWKNNIFIRYCVLPRDGDPILFETAGSDLECAKIDAPWLDGNIRPAITWKWAETAEAMMAEKMARSVMDVLTENGVDKERIGLDVYAPGAAEALGALGINIVSAWPAMSGARV